MINVDKQHGWQHDLKHQLVAALQKTFRQKAFLPQQISQKDQQDDGDYRIECRHKNKIPFHEPPPAAIVQYFGPVCNLKCHEILRVLWDAYVSRKVSSLRICAQCLAFCRDIV
jgi:hypothetical protein